MGEVAARTAPAILAVCLAAAIWSCAGAPGTESRASPAVGELHQVELRVTCGARCQVFTGGRSIDVVEAWFETQEMRSGQTITLRVVAACQAAPVRAEIRVDGRLVASEDGSASPACRRTVRAEVDHVLR